MSLYDKTREEAESYIDDSIVKGDTEEDGNLICYDPDVEKDLDLHGNIHREFLPRICCFSGEYDNILMWSHYADSHKGICLRFRSVEDWENLEFGKYCLNFDYRDYSFHLLLARNDPFHNIYYKKKFLKIEYKPKEYIYPKLNLLDVNDLQMVKNLLNKLDTWCYEDEYRMMITRYDVKGGLLTEDEFEQGLVKYQKDNLEGIIFGMKITHENAKLVYDTVKKNYLDKGFTVNFYEAKEVKREYRMEICEINDIDTYFITV